AAFFRSPGSAYSHDRSVLAELRAGSPDPPVSVLATAIDQYSVVAVFGSHANDWTRVAHTGQRARPQGMTPGRRSRARTNSRAHEPRAQPAGTRIGLGRFIPPSIRRNSHAILPPNLKNKKCRYRCCFGDGSRPYTVRAAMSSMNS